jgi:anti-sigma B factor antagonist
MQAESRKPLTHDSGLCGQTGNGLRTVTRTTATSGSNLEISVEQLGSDAIIRPSGRINVDSSPDLRDCLQAILSAAPLPRAITVDLAGVPYIETSGIATLIEAFRIARHRQTIFCLRGLSGSVLRIFEVTGVLALFEASDCGQKVS